MQPFSMFIIGFSQPWKPSASMSLGFTRIRLDDMPLTTVFCSRFLLILACSAQLFSFSAAECYFPKGNLDTWGTPCNPNVEHSICCHPEDICLSNGLCFNTVQVSFIGFLAQISAGDHRVLNIVWIVRSHSLEGDW